MDESPKNSITELEAAIEAILYAAGHSVSYAKLSEVLGLQVRELKQLISHMSEKYNSENSQRGISLMMFDDGCQFCTKENFAPYIREALGIRRGGNLSASSMEVLAIVAYNQPVTRSYVDTVRGVDSAYAMNSLIDKELIEAVGRLDAPGRPMLYGTTDNFLRVFGINSVSELPDVEPIKIDGEASGQVAVSEQLSLDIEQPEQSPEEEIPEQE
ncbi:MAG: SMC-Scp complex subunit ScpB [Clostridia bacterium]|nr:SMC-Scp complex subunit ScpB [Clostridia bacterium]MBQ4327398.1 SMC-Scp complex subunit ScpB [Clostridia bacterium]